MIKKKNPRNTVTIVDYGQTLKAGPTSETAAGLVIRLRQAAKRESWFQVGVTVKRIYLHL